MWYLHLSPFQAIKAMTPLKDDDIILLTSFIPNFPVFLVVDLVFLLDILFLVAISAVVT